ncbi:VOC family protein [Roseitranquillus sediminis]|uniref:VOC family protein n=1 Tax=Roseitranquillus sediminis TaxID=2809051 RepID=UPI001D0C7C00|nr:VOC family protein [Roseitranquillus sediminis]MBM9593081.1 VOC family protein [Roseitranquillus sediminis]
MSEQHGVVWWSELMTRDPAMAKDYYHEVCGWEFEEMPMEGGTYVLGKSGGRPVVGIMDITNVDGMGTLPPHWFTYLAVDDVDVAVERTRANGGRIVREPFDVSGVGRIAIVTDPTGATVGLMTPSQAESAAA